jgi:hypothetical protein
LNHNGIVVRYSEKEMRDSLAYLSNLNVPRCIFCCKVMVKLKVLFGIWPAPGSEDTKLGVLMELEVGHGET